MSNEDNQFYHLNIMIINIDDYDEISSRIKTLNRLVEGDYAIEGGLNSIEKLLNKAHVYSVEDE